MTGEEAVKIPWTLRLGRFAWIASLGVGYYIYRNLLFHTQIGNNIMLKRSQLEDLKTRNFTVLDNVLVHGHYINQQPKRCSKGQRVAIVGGGKQGIAISKKLLDSGYEVILIDKEDEQNNLSYEHPHKLELSSFLRGLVWSNQSINVSWNIFLEKYFTLWLTNSIYAKFNQQADKDKILEELNEAESQKYHVKNPLIFDYLLELCRSSNRFLEVKKCQVQKYVISNQSIIGLQTTHGFFLVDKIVVASGSAAKDLVGLLGYRLPILTGNYYSAETQPISQDVINQGLAKLDQKQINAYSRGDRAGVFTSLVLEASSLQRDVHTAISPNYQDIQEVQTVKQQAFNVDPKSLSHKVFNHVLIPDGNPIVEKIQGYPNIYLGVGGSDNQKMGIAAQIAKYVEGDQNDLALSMRRFLLV